MSINSTSILSYRQNLTEKDLKSALASKYAGERPSQRTIDIVMQLAGSLEVVDTKIGNIDLFLN